MKRDESYFLQKGSYSFLFFISNVENSSLLTVVEGSIFDHDAGDEMDDLYPAELLAICDLNDDKIQELIVSTGNYEGGGEEILTFINGEFRMVLSCICGT